MTIDTISYFDLGTFMKLKCIHYFVYMHIQSLPQVLNEIVADSQYNLARLRTAWKESKFIHMVVNGS